MTQLLPVNAIEGRAKRFVLRDGGRDVLRVDLSRAMKAEDLRALFAAPEAPEQTEAKPKRARKT